MCLWKMQKTHTERQGVYKGLNEKKSFLQNEGMHLRQGLFSSPGSVVVVVREMRLANRRACKVPCLIPPGHLN